MQVLSAIDLPSGGPSVRLGVHTLTTREGQYKYYGYDGTRVSRIYFNIFEKTHYLINTLYVPGTHQI